MEQQKRAKQYETIKIIIKVSETVLSFIILFGFVMSAGSAQLRDWVQGVFINPYMQLLLFSAIIGGFFFLITFPLSFVSGYLLEHRYQLSNQKLVGWLWEKVKSMVVGLILFVPILLIFYYLLRTFPDLWWLLLGGILFVFSLAIGRIAPQVIFPLFYKFDSLEDDTIQDKMHRLARKGNFALEGVYRFNMSKTTKKANAAFTGLGKSKRIIIGDTLLDSFSPDEIETVLAHEVGHFVHKHIWISLIVSTIITFLSLFAAHVVYQELIGQFNFNGTADLAALPLLSIIMSILALITTPLTNLLSRKHEWQADRYALEHSTAPQAFPQALKKLSDINLADQKPHPLVEFLFHSHPAIQKRIDVAEQNLKNKGIVVDSNETVT
ncbi:MAG: M48 family metalloprotease [Caldithrix sp.]|nr:M48 family metalloprotease [Caldithrix sp.]